VKLASGISIKRIKREMKYLKKPGSKNYEKSNNSVNKFCIYNLFESGSCYQSNKFFEGIK